jgi:hypothetical protein
VQLGASSDGVLKDHTLHTSELELSKKMTDTKEKGEKGHEER